MRHVGVNSAIRPSKTIKAREGNIEWDGIPLDGRDLIILDQ
jgi:hypothetical protein